MSAPFIPILLLSTARLAAWRCARDKGMLLLRIQKTKGWCRRTLGQLCPAGPNAIPRHLRLWGHDVGKPTYILASLCLSSTRRKGNELST